MTDNDLDVLIVGAGPSGMLLAAALERHDIRFRIVDQDEGPTSDTRAPVLWQRTQEILATLGMRDLWVPESEEMLEESLHFYGRFAGALSVTAPNSPYPKARYVGQDVTERLLEQHLGELGVQVERGTRAVSYADEPTAARVTLERSDSGREDVRADWVVSAEGSHSVVRHDLGLDFAGEKYLGYRIHVADVQAHWTLATPVGQTFFFVEDHGYMGGERMPGHPDRFYFYILTVDDKPDDDSNELSLEEAQRLVRQFSGDDAATLSDPIWLNSARYRHGLARTYAQGRAFLVGDTARSAPPLYGQGMNYAMHDVWNLAWKLGHVVRGLAPASLLQTFDEERRKVGGDLDALIDGTFRFITKPKPLQATAVRAVMPTLLKSELVTRPFNQQFTEVAVTYAGLGVSAQKNSLGKLHAGDRLPALWVKQLPECTSANLLDLVDGVHWTYLVVGPAGSDPGRTQGLLDDAAATAATYPDAVRAALLTQGPRRPDLVRVTTLVDAEGRFVRDQRLPDLAVVLVRPDGYIGWVGEQAGQELHDFLSRWLLPVPSAANPGSMVG